MASKFFKAFKFFKGKVSPTIKSVKPNLTKTVKQTKSDEYSKRIRALSGAQKKLQTGKQMMKEAQKERKKLVDTGRAFQFKHSKSFHALEPGDKDKFKDRIKIEKTKKFKKGKELDREKKMGGGMMGRRFGYSEGSSKGKVPTTPKEKSLAKLAPPKDRITFGDVVAGRTKGKRMQAKEGTGPEQFMRSGVKEDPMRDQMKQPLKLKRSKALMLEDLKKSKFKKRKP